MHGRSRLFMLVGIGVTIAGSLVACVSRQAPALTVKPLKASGIYALGEKGGWTFQLPSGSSGTSLRYTLKRDNAVVVRSGDLALTDQPTTVEFPSDQPGMWFLSLTSGSGKPQNFGAAVAPDQIKPVAPRPADFDAFWDRKKRELRAIPANPVVTPGESYKPEVEFSTVKMDHINGTNVYGQMAKPKAKGKYPAILILQWASPPYPLHPSWAIERAAEGWLALNIEPHNVPTNAPPEYYAGLPESLKNYAATGRDDREKSSFVEMYLRGVRAVDYLATHPEWDGKTILVMGTSMGGQQTFAVAGLHPGVTHLIVNVPAGCDLNAGLHDRQQGYPYFSTQEPKTMETARYVDAINFAPNIRATSLVAMGFVDDVSPPTGIWTVFNLIKGPKEVVPLVDSPHNNMATPEQQRPYVERSAEWLKTIPKSGKIDLRRGF